jgi:hypothetical protein
VSGPGGRGYPTTFGRSRTTARDRMGIPGPLRIGVGDELRDMGPGERHVFALRAQVRSVRG